MNVQTTPAMAKKIRSGMKEIADFYDLPPAKTGRLARQNLLPGVFRLGRGYFLDEVIARELIREKAMGAR